MIPPHLPSGLTFKRGTGFSLLELLVVMAILGLLGALAVPAVSSLTRSSQMNKNLLVLAGVCEQARQYAISKNTYVWVVLSPPEAAGSDESVKIGQIASMDGTDVLGWSSSSTLLSGASNLEMVGKPQELRLARIESGTDAAGAALASVNIVGGSPDQTYTRAVQFTPTGEARVGTSVSRYIDMAILQHTGTNAPNRAVLRVAGLTGKTSVQRD